MTCYYDENGICEPQRNPQILTSILQGIFYILYIAVRATTVSRNIFGWYICVYAEHKSKHEIIDKLQKVTKWY